MCNDDARQTLNGQNGGADGIGRGGVQRCRGLVDEQDGRLPQQAARDGDALPLAAGEAGAVLTADIVLATLGQKGSQTGLLRGLLHKHLVKVAEHRDVVADGIVEDKHVLLHDGNKAVE